uniref:Vir n=1 Tax=Metamycoplasma arthritidis TaxID=2111 RepID=Q53VN1_METAT|nr:Vir [Mycoplasma arthritidis] [Metamycoplasma arthritidis]AAT66154.1 Vir [Mycoplasma arthritidis] [Metamycoplasma arthritidis]
MKKMFLFPIIATPLITPFLVTSCYNPWHPNTKTGIVTLAKNYQKFVRNISDLSDSRIEEIYKIEYQTYDKYKQHVIKNFKSNENYFWFLTNFSHSTRWKDASDWINDSYKDKGKYYEKLIKRYFAFYSYTKIGFSVNADIMNSWNNKEWLEKNFKNDKLALSLIDINNLKTPKLVKLKNNKYVIKNNLVYIRVHDPTAIFEKSLNIFTYIDIYI